jgi:hypothetical protein
MSIYKVSTLNNQQDAFGNTISNQSAIILHELKEPFERIEFQFMPETVTWGRVGNWVNVPIPGRNNSRKHLTGGDDTLKLSLDFNSLFELDKSMCIQKLSFLHSLTATDGFNGAGRNVKLAWGETDLFRFKIWIVRSVSGNMSQFNSNYGYNPQQLIVDLELELDPEKNPRLADIRLPERLIPDNTVNFTKQ